MDLRALSSIAPRRSPPLWTNMHLRARPLWVVDRTHQPLSSCCYPKPVKSRSMRGEGRSTGEDVLGCPHPLIIRPGLRLRCLFSSLLAHVSTSETSTAVFFQYYCSIPSIQAVGSLQFNPLNSEYGALFVRRLNNNKPSGQKSMVRSPLPNSSFSFPSSPSNLILKPSPRARFEVHVPHKAQLSCTL